jgi:hypothetical protein
MATCFQFLSGVAGVILTARIDRAHSDRARSVSIGVTPVTAPFFKILLVCCHNDGISHIIYPGYHV